MVRSFDRKRFPKRGHRQTKGSGLWDIIQDNVQLNPIAMIRDGAKHFFDDKRYTLSLSSVMKRAGVSPVVKIEVSREPIASMIDKAFDVISFGSWGSAKTDNAIDKFFHLFCILSLADGTKYRLEKNANISLSKSDGHVNSDDVIVIQSNTGLSIADMLEKTRLAVGDDRFFIYDAFKNNCQDFLINILQSNGLLTPEASNFIKQDVKDVAEKMPGYAKRFANSMTDLGHTVGAGVRYMRGKRACGHRN